MDDGENGAAGESPDTPEVGACTISGLARWAGVSRTTVQAWMRAEDCPRESDGSLNPWKICLWRESKKRPQFSPAVAGGDLDAMLMAGGSTKSKALEKYRRARAEHALLDLEERRGSLVSRELAHEGLMAIAHLIRQAGDQLQRQFGSEAHAILDGALNQAEANINGLFGSDSA